MNTNFPTAIPHDDSKALSAEDRQRFNNLYRKLRDTRPDTDKALALFAALVIHTVLEGVAEGIVQGLADDTHTEVA